MNTKRTILMTLVLLVVLAACAPVPPAGGNQEPSPPIGENADSGIEGQAVIGPTCPAVSPDQDCEDLPFQTTILILDADENTVAEVKTDEDGYFKVSLPPGGYLVLPMVPDAFPDDAAQPGAEAQAQQFPLAAVQAVKVTPGQFTEVTIAFDSGVR